MTDGITGAMGGGKPAGKEIIFLDNTRISGLKKCPMFYMIRTKLGWVRDSVKPALGFGGAWHEGKAEVFRQVKLLKQLRPTVPAREINKDFWTQVHEKAFASFMAEWTLRELPDPARFPELMEQYFPRVPGTAKEMLWHYIDQNKSWLWEIEILDIEKPFVVPLLETDTQRIFLVGRRDMTYRDSQGVWANEHKTTTLGAAEKYIVQGQIFQWKFLQMFNMSPQVAGYTYSIKLEYGNEARGVVISGDLVHKKHNDKFQNIPIWKDDSWLESWYTDTQFWVKQLLWHDKEKFYPHNENSCDGQYGPCEYKDMCEACSDPRELSQVWQGYKVEFWEPFDEDAMKEIMLRIENG